MSPENWVGLIVAPLRIHDSVIMPQSRGDCTPESEEYRLTWAIRSWTEACRAAVFYYDNTAAFMKLFLRGP